MSSLAKFITGDGVEHEVAVGSPAYDHMVKDGSFTRVQNAECTVQNEEPASAEAAVEAPAEEAPVEDAAAAEVKAPAKKAKGK